VAKVMISMPDELLEKVDRHARKAGTTRSGWLREIAEHAIANDAEARAERIREALARMTAWGGHEATGADWIRADRDRDNP
jgi:metal-responsive CopG/Arc/MetJ family transcriptional regulator